MKEEILIQVVDYTYIFMWKYSNEQRIDLPSVRRYSFETELIVLWLHVEFHHFQHYHCLRH